MATEWKKVRLGDIATFSNGINFGKESYKAGVKLIGVSNFGNRFFPDYDELEEVDENVLRPNDYLKNGDIVFVRSNGNKELVGRCMLIQNPPSTVTYSGFCIRARLNNIDENCPSFFAYYFKSKDFRKAMSNTAVGANIQNLNQGLLSNHIFYLPPLETQQKIAGILSAYDDLIENNRKQIKLLEEAAQKLYKEWFVKLNFPGHENVKIVDGVPEGWKKEKLENWCRVFTGKKNANQDVEKGIYPFFTCAPVPLLSNDSLYEGKAVIISGNGSYTGRTQYYDGNFDLYQRTYACVRQKQEDYEYMPFIYYSMKILFEPIKMGGTKGSAIPYIVMADITNTEFLYQYDICKKFSIFAESVLDKIQILQKQIRLLQSARDKLLPRLMNGDINV